MTRASGGAQYDAGPVSAVVGYTSPPRSYRRPESTSTARRPGTDAGAREAAECSPASTGNGSPAHIFELIRLIEEQRRDDEIGHRRIRNAPLEILAGLNPWALKQRRPRYFLSGRHVHRRPQARKGARVEHGTATMYRYGCRCDPCRTAHSDRRRKQRTAVAA